MDARKVFPTLPFFKWCAEKLIGFADRLTHGPTDVHSAHQWQRQLHLEKRVSKELEALVLGVASCSSRLTDDDSLSLLSTSAVSGKDYISADAVTNNRRNWL